MISNAVQTGVLGASAYRLERVIGQGRTGIVFAARDRRAPEHRLAIKFLRRELAHDRAIAAEFVARARAAAAVRCDALCRLLDVAESQSGVPCIVMEYLEGRDLAKVLAQEPRYEPRAAASIVVQVCRGLMAALELGFVHADLRPSKLVMLETEPQVRLLDLAATPGLIPPPPGAAASHAAAWLSAVRYAAPEQLDDPCFADTATNVWALGTIMYELLCGWPLFPEPTPERLFAAIRTLEPPSLREQGVELPLGFARAIETALSRSRAVRYASVAQLAAALEPFAQR